VITATANPAAPKRLLRIVFNVPNLAGGRVSPRR
jgi:hypothetical protein